MARNLHPADELAMIQSDIQRLRERERFLHNGFLQQTWPSRGKDAVVEISSVHSRVLIRDKLPKTILDDPEFWLERQKRQVSVKPLRAIGADDFDCY